MSALSTINLCENVFMLKIVFHICCGIDVLKKNVVANPKYLKGIHGKKTDKKDSIWLCDLHMG